MQLSDFGVRFVAREEGGRSSSGEWCWYQDALGYWTVGIGHLYQPEMDVDIWGRCLTDSEAWALFRRDSERFTDAINRYVTVRLSQHQWDALFDFAFNWGVGTATGFPATSVCRLVNERAWEELAVDLVHGRGPSTPDYPDGRPYDKGLAGVRERRKREVSLFFDADYGPGIGVHRERTDARRKLFVSLFAC